MKPEELALLEADEQIPVLARLLRGETVNIQDNRDIYYAVNMNLVDLDEVVKARVTPAEIRHAEIMRELNQQNNGFSDKRHFRNIGGLPPWLVRRDEFRQASDDERRQFTKFFMKRYWKWYCYVDPNTI